MPQYIRIAVITVLSAVFSTQAFAQGKSDESNGVPHVIQEALANGINVEVTNSPTVTVENQVDVSVVGETEVVVTNASPIEVTVSNFPDTSGGGDDESGYVGLSSVAMTGAGGLTGKVMQCQTDFGPTANICGDSEITESHKLTKFAADITNQGVNFAWIKPRLISAVQDTNGRITRIYSSFSTSPGGRQRWSGSGVCSSDSENQIGAVLGQAGYGGGNLCSADFYVACCR